MKIQDVELDGMKLEAAIRMRSDGQSIALDGSVRDKCISETELCE